VPCRRNPRGELDRFVQVAGVEQVEAGEHLARLGERAVEERHLAAAHAHRRRGVRRVQRLGREHAPARGELRRVVGALGVAACRPVLGVEVDEAEVLHSDLLAAAAVVTGTRSARR
jgi:hypothetical protein